MKLSNRALAKKINVSEATIRNMLRYARVADQRSEYAGEDRTDEVAKLTGKQVELCALLPEEFVNKWLDSGGNIKDILPEPDACPYTATMALQEADLFDVLESEYLEFPRSLRYALRLAEWYTRHQLLPEVREYIKAVGKLRLPGEVLDCLPVNGTSNDRRSQIALSLADWQAALGQCETGAGNAAGIIPLVEAAVRVRLREAGVDPATVFSPVIIEMEQQLAEAPASIRDAKFLTLEERHCLHSLINEALEEAVVAEDLLLEARRATLELIRVERTGKHEGVRGRCAPSVEYVTRVFCEQLSEIRDEAIRRVQDEHFADDEALRDGIIEHLSEVTVISEATVNGQPAAEVLSARLRDLDRAEFHLLASLVLSNDVVDDACRRWLLAMGGDVQEETDLKEES
jgi:DNA-binding Lrp family transcriptional regulator